MNKVNLYHILYLVTAFSIQIHLGCATEKLMKESNKPSQIQNSSAGRNPSGLKRQPNFENLESYGTLQGKIPSDLRGSICAFDIDGTLIEPSARDMTKRSPVEPNLPNILHQLSDKGCTVIAITARVPGERTKNELQEANFGFFITHEFSRPFHLVNHILYKTESGNVQYADGILFASNDDKGIALEHLLQSGDVNPGRIHPKYVIFIDDALSEVKNVRRSLESLGIPNYVFRYQPPHREKFDY
jgi:hypothetical protein